MSWREIYIAWWLRILGNYPRAPQGLICDESGDNASQSIPVSGGQREQQLPWFNMSCWLIQYYKRSPMALWINSSLALRGQAASMQVYLTFVSVQHNKREKLIQHFNGNASERDISPPLRTVLLLLTAPAKTSIPFCNMNRRAVRNTYDARRFLSVSERK